MDSSHQSILDLAAQRGLIRPRDLNERGLPTVALTRLVRQGLLQRDGGRYGRWNAVGLSTYAIGILVQIPFMVTPMYTGPLAEPLASSTSPGSSGSS